MSLKYNSKTYDILGVSAALLCLIHCIIFPLLIFIPIGISHNPYIDLTFLLPGIWSVYKTTRRNDSILVKYLLWISVAVIAGSVLAHLFFHWHSPLMYAGAAGLISGHLINWKNHKTMHTEHE